MQSFQNLFVEILPLYAISALGFVIGKAVRIDTKSITTLTIYVISPVVFLLSVAQIKFTAAAIFSPLIIFVLATLVGAMTLRITKYYTTGHTPYLASMASGTNNWGYFGIPIAFALFDPTMVASYIVIGFGVQLFENTFGIYFLSRGHTSPFESFKNIFRFPAIYAILGGLLLSYFRFDLPEYGHSFLNLFKGAYTVLGMMIIGLGLSSLDRFRIDFRFVGTMFILKFLLWPLLAGLIIWLDLRFGFLGETFHKPLLLFSIMPMAANNIAFAAQFNMDSAKVSVAVLLTTLFALLYIPLAIGVLGIS